MKANKNQEELSGRVRDELSPKMVLLAESSKSEMKTENGGNIAHVERTATPGRHACLPCVRWRILQGRGGGIANGEKICVQ